MKCEQVEERLSAYLDDMLAPGEHQSVTHHLQTCTHCSMELAELRQHDLLLAQLPRVYPPAALHERLFAKPEMRELIAMLNQQIILADRRTHPPETGRARWAKVNKLPRNNWII